VFALSWACLAISSWESIIITTNKLSEVFGRQWSIADFIMERHLRWLGHPSHIADDRLPKPPLFGELQRKQPFHATKKWCRDGVLSDLKTINVDDCWYTLFQSRTRWIKLCNAEVCSVVQSRRNNTCATNLFPHDNTYNCICDQQFHCQGVLTRHRRYCTVCEDNSLSLH